MFKPSLRYTLITDGSSDKALLHIINWLLEQHFPNIAYQDTWADLRNLPNPPKLLVEKIKIGLNLYPCDLLFIHRDAEKQTIKQRQQEINEAYTVLKQTGYPPYICIIPVRMLESWLFSSETALRNAAGNPKGKQILKIPKFNTIEQLAQTKNTLHSLLTTACGLKGRQQRNFNVDKAIHRLAEYTQDFSPLRQLKAFQIFENDVIQFTTQYKAVNNTQ